MKKTYMLFVCLGLVLFGCLVLFVNHASAASFSWTGTQYDIDMEGYSLYWVDDLYQYDVLMGVGHVWNPYYGVYVIDVKCSIINGTGVEYNKFFIMNASTANPLFYVSADASLLFGERVYENYTRNGCVIMYAKDDAISGTNLFYNYNITSVGLGLYASTVYSNDSKSFTLMGLGGAYAEGINSHIVSGTLFNQKWILYNNIFSGSTLSSVTLLDSFNNKIFGSGIGVQKKGAGVTVKDSSVFNCTLVYKDTTTFGVGHSYFIDVLCDWGVRALFDMSLNHGSLYQENTHRQYFVDKDNVPLSDVTFKIYDSSGLVFSDVSDASGSVDVATLVISRFYQDAGGEKTEWFTPFTFVANKSGYQIINVTGLNASVSEKTNWTWEMIEEPTVDVTENLVNCAGTFEYSWDWVLNKLFAWANYTGDPCFPPDSTSFQVHNPNPANNTFVNNSFINNDLSVQLTGMNTAVDITYENFTDPPAAIPGDYSISIEGMHPGNSPVIWNTSSVYNTVWESHQGIINPGNPYVGQYLEDGDYTIMRSFLIFNTSSIPEGAIINSGYVSLVVYDDYSTDDFNVTLQPTRQPIPHYPNLVIGDYWRYGFAGDLGHVNTSGVSSEDWFNITLNPTGLNDVLSGEWRATDSVRWCLRSDRDELGVAPTDWEFIIFYGYGGATPSWKYPHLILNYTVPASNWEYILNVSFSSNHTGSWVVYNVSHVNSNGTVCAFCPGLGVVNNTVYWWRVVAENSTGTVLGNETWTFTTANRRQIIPIGGGMGSSAMSLSMGMIGCLAGGIILIPISRRRRRGQQA